MKTNLIGICGEKGSGKGTLGRIIANESPYDIYHKQFSEPLKKFVSDISGVKMDVCHFMDEDYGKYANTLVDFSQEAKNQYVPHYQQSVGQMLVSVGECLRQSYSRRVFTKAQFKKDIEGIWCFTDVRNQEEMEEILLRDGALIFVDRPDSHKEKDSRLRDELEENIRPNFYKMKDKFDGLFYETSNCGRYGVFANKVKEIAEDLGIL